MAGLSARAEGVIDAIEGERRLDGIAAPAADAVKRLTGGRTIKSLLSGSWLGHTLHPILTDLPIGMWAAATVVDVAAGDRGADAARTLVGVGVLSALPAAASGASDWSDTYGPAQRLGLVHGAVNAVGTLLQSASWIARRRGARGAGIALSLLGLSCTVGSAYLGGHLSLARGIGVNHTAFQGGTKKWTDVAADVDLEDGTPLRVMAGKVPVVLVRTAGEVHALSATCTHAGGPLDQGTVADGCITCPWHGSRFRLSDGTVDRGPAAYPEPCWDVRTEDGRIEVRRSI